MLGRKDFVDYRGIEHLIREYSESVLVHALGFTDVQTEVIRAQRYAALGSAGAARLTSTAASSACTATSTAAVAVSATTTAATTSVGVRACLGAGLEGTLGSLRLGVPGLSHGCSPWVFTGALGCGLARRSLFFLLGGALRGLWAGLLLRLLRLVALGCLVAILVVFSFFGNLFKCVGHLFDCN